MPEFRQLLEGYRRFRDQGYPQQRARFDKLAEEGQHPKLMIIGCSDSRVDPAAQRQRDGEARRILLDELRKEEVKLAELQRDYNNGEPERRGDERNYQRYLDRVAEMKAAIARKEADIAALKRELAKLPS